MKKLLQRKSGITLIALVITIIVMLILAGVSIATLTGDNGVLTQASNAKKDNEIAEAKERAKIDIMAWIANEKANDRPGTLDNDAIKGILKGKDYVNGEPGDISFKVGKDEYEIFYSELQNIIESSNNVDEIIEAPAEGEYAFSYKMGENVTAYIVENVEETANAGEKVYDLLLIGTGEISSFTDWKEAAKAEGVLTERNYSDGVIYSYEADVINIKISKGITTIGEKAFKEIGWNVKSIVIPNSVTTIGNEAFTYFTELKSIKIPNSVTSIGNSAFSHCSSLENIEIPNSVTTIGYYAFGECYGLKSVIISSSVGTIDSYAFAYCSELENVEISEGITTIADRAFYKCDKLQKIVIPASVTHFSHEGEIDIYYKGTYEQYKSANISNRVYLDSKNSGQVQIDGNTYESVYQYFNSPESSGQEIPVPVEGTYKTSFSMGNNVTAYLVENAEASATAGEKVFDMLIIGTGAIGDFESWKANAMAVGVVEFYDGSDYDYTFAVNVKNIKISKGITEIGTGAFYNCLDLETVSIPNSVTTIRSFAFNGYVDLKYLIIPKSITTIEFGANLYCADVIYYNGTSENLKNINGYYEGMLENAVIYCDWGI